MSGARSLWILAQGKFSVNGYEERITKTMTTFKESTLTTTSPTKPYSSHASPNSKFWTTVAVCSLDHGLMGYWSRSLGGVRHLGTNASLVLVDNNREIKHT